MINVRQEWLTVNSDSGAVVTALFVAVAGDLLLEKRGEFRVASGAVIPNLRKIKMKSDGREWSCEIDSRTTSRKLPSLC